MVGTPKSFHGSKTLPGLEWVQNLGFNLVVGLPTLSFSFVRLPFPFRDVTSPDYSSLTTPGRHRGLPYDVGFRGVLTYLIL